MPLGIQSADKMAKKSFYLTSISMASLYVFSQIAGLFFSIPFKDMNIHSFSNPNSVWNSIFYIAILLIVTGIMLLTAKFKMERFIKYFIIIGLALSILFVLYPFLLFYYPYVYSFPIGFPVDLDFIISTIITVFLMSLLVLYPEWYVLDVVGFVAASGMIAILGISFGILPAFILLVALAIYDAISVYKTKHMIALAGIVSDLKVPAMVIVPKESSYSYMDDNKPLKDKLDSHEERESLLMGLGDIVIPGIMAVSAFSFLPTTSIYLYIPSNLWVAIITIIGSVTGFSILMLVSRSGNPQAGLPFLNGGAISAFLISMLLFYHTFTYLI